MPERRTKRRTTRQPDPTKVTDDRLQQGSQSSPAGPGPSPYDVAPPGMPEDRVIRKGKPEPPGPTEPVDLADDRTDEYAGTGELGGDGLHDRLNNERRGRRKGEVEP